MKRILSLILAFAMLLFAAVPGFAEADPKTITFLTVGDPYVGAIKELLPEFEAKYGVKVVIDSVPY